MLTAKPYHLRIIFSVQYKNELTLECIVISYPREKYVVATMSCGHQNIRTAKMSLDQSENLTF